MSSFIYFLDGGDCKFELKIKRSNIFKRISFSEFEVRSRLGLSVVGFNKELK